MFGQYTVGALTIKPNLVLAPMSGVTSSAFRRLICRLNPGSVGLVISEFVSVEGMTRASHKTLRMLQYREEERPVGIQIFGYDIARMRDAGRMVEDTGANLLDINCGCPAPKVVKRGGGCELMRQPLHLAKILAEVRRAVKMPLTLKMRSGWDESSKNAVEIARIAWLEGLDGLAVHGRTRSQLYRGSADWSFVSAVREAVPIPVLGSGDVVDRASAEERLKSGASGLLIGRGAIENPWIFSELINGTGLEKRTDVREVVAVLKLYAELLAEDFTPHGALGKLKQLASQLARRHPFRKALLRTMTMEAALELLRQVADGTPQGLLVEGESLPLSGVVEEGIIAAQGDEGTGI